MKYGLELSDTQAKRCELEGKKGKAFERVMFSKSHRGRKSNSVRLMTRLST